MSLSAHEKMQFERLTADLEFDDSDLKKMVRRDKATSMSYMPLPGHVASPSFEIVLLVMAVLGLAIAVVGKLTDNASLMAVGAVSATLLCVSCLILSGKQLLKS